MLTSSQHSVRGLLATLVRYGWARRRDLWLEFRRRPR